MYQCAEIISTARGRGVVLPSSAHDAVKRFVSSVFIGLPWPMNTAGMRALAFMP